MGKAAFILLQQNVGAVRGLYHRMMVIMQPGAYGSWLDPEKMNQAECEAWRRAG